MLKLYRADKRGNKTLPEKYATDGLFTKQLNSGDYPVPHKKYGWLKTIKSHIKYTSEEEKFIYDTTQYLSFTSDEGKALFYLSTNEHLSFEKTDRFSAEAFVFTATIDPIKTKPMGNGVFLYSFKCNYDKTRNDVNFQTFLSNYLNCNICSCYKNYEHHLILVDAKTYLFNFKNVYADEYANAYRDSEWLLMPADPMVGIDEIGFQARIHIADFWSVDFYKYK